MVCEEWVQLPQKVWDSSMGIEIEPGKTIGAHLIKKGIKSYSVFVEHLKKIETDFWKNRFPVYDKWKRDHYEIYKKYGYVSLKTGFACQGIMTRNQAVNYPIQGSAFHCLLWSFITLSNRLQELNFKSRIVGQIHDSIVIDIYPPELLEVYKMVQKIGTKELPKEFSWINVPLTIEADLCPVNASWAEKEKWNPILK